MRIDFASFGRKLSSNWKSGITVALVSIPLSVSLAVASNSTPTAGIITAVWAGLIASYFGGSYFNIVGPTGALSGILATYALMHGAGSLPMMAIVAGIFILVAYKLRLERFLVFVPASTVHGFTLGVAFIIGLNQLPFALGLNGLEKHEKFVENVWEAFQHVGSTSMSSAIMFVCVLAFLLLLARYVPRLPGAIVVSVVGIVFGYAAGHGLVPFAVQTLGMKFPDIAPRLFETPAFSLSPSLIVPAITVAVIAILETMISAKIADGMTKTKHDKRKEMLGLGLANLGSGLLGGIPATAALARTSLNVKSGATDRLSATISSVCVALIALIFLTSFRFIPLSVIAAILVYVAIRMIEHEHFLRMFRSDKFAFALSMVVAFVTIWMDPIDGILIGTAIALLVFMEKISHGQFELIVSDVDYRITDKIAAEKIENLPKHGDTLIYSIKGQLVYVNGASHIARFEEGLNGYRHVILRLRELSFVDLDGVDAFDEIVRMIQAEEKTVLIAGIHPLIETMLDESETYHALKKQGLVFKRTSEALTHLGY